MVLSLEQITKVTQGAVTVEYVGGEYHFYRMTDGEYDITEKSIADATAGVILEFKTDATKLNLTVNTELSMDIRSFFAFDIICNEKYVGSVKNFEDTEMKDNFGFKKFETGVYSGEFDLGQSEKTVKIVMPHTLIGTIKYLELADATYVEPCRKDKILIAYGDSITQGYDGQHPSRTYAYSLGQYLNAEVYNKAIGGLVFEYKRVECSLHQKADYVSVAMGTNDWTVHTSEQIRQDVADFIKAISYKYPDAVKFVITPIWRASYKEEKIGGTFEDMSKIITEECERYPDIKVIQGINLVEHSPKYFGDGGLHPNDEGFNLYSKNLAGELSKIL
ncbi:MAG: SGNH/GDSL hydrolase family protein [Clostridia bacterium]|nr:SGNH/GDSL hydrolase family protein [Clostridia bacterium]